MLYLAISEAWIQAQRVLRRLARTLIEVPFCAPKTIGAIRFCTGIIAGEAPIWSRAFGITVFIMLKAGEQLARQIQTNTILDTF
jgi:hypothetical protein